MGLLQQAEVDVVGGAVEVKGAGLPKGPELVRLGDGEHPFPRPLPAPAVEAQAKGLLEEQGQALGKGGGLGDDAHLPGGEVVAKEQDAAGLRLGAAGPGELGPAQLCFRVASKGHGASLLYGGVVHRPMSRWSSSTR